MRCVFGRKEASAENWDLHHLQVIRADKIRECRWHLVVGLRLWTPFNPERGFVIGAEWFRAVGEADGLHAGSFRNVLRELANEFTNLVRRLLCNGGRKGQIERQDIVRIKTGIRPPNASEAANRKSGADQKNNGETKLGDDKCRLRGDVARAD